MKHYFAEKLAPDEPLHFRWTIVGHGFRIAFCHTQKMAETIADAMNRTQDNQSEHTK